MTQPSDAGRGEGALDNADLDRAYDLIHISLRCKCRWCQDCIDRVCEANDLIVTGDVAPHHAAVEEVCRRLSIASNAAHIMAEHRGTVYECAEPDCRADREAIAACRQRSQ